MVQAPVEIELVGGPMDGQTVMLQVGCINTFSWFAKLGGPFYLYKPRTNAVPLCGAIKFYYQGWRY